MSAKHVIKLLLHPSAFGHFHQCNFFVFFHYAGRFMLAILKSRFTLLLIVLRVPFRICHTETALNSGLSSTSFPTPPNSSIRDFRATLSSSVISLRVGSLRVVLAKAN